MKTVMLTLTLSLALAPARAGEHPKEHPTAAGQEHPKEHPSKKKKEHPEGHEHMDHLFDAQLRHTGKVKLEPRGLKEGSLVGGGEGQALGPRIKGKMRWSLYENSTKRGCTMQLPGVIETDDGAKITFEGQGHAIVPDENEPAKWKVAGAFRFETKDKRYDWINSVLALWEGDFDMSAGQARYRLYVPGGAHDLSK